MEKHSWDYRNIFYLTVFLCVSFTYGSVSLEVGLLKYKYTSPKSCDNILFFTKCDPFFKMCFETPPENRCDWIKTSNVDETNELTDILHGTSIKPNPVSRTFDSWQGKLTLRIQIWNANTFSQHYKIDEAIWIYSGAPNVSLDTVLLVGNNSKARVTIYIKIYCDENYYGLSCTSFCESTINSYCDGNGVSVCKTGTPPDCSVNIEPITFPSSIKLSSTKAVSNASSLSNVLEPRVSSTTALSNTLTHYEENINLNLLDLSSLHTSPRLGPPDANPFSDNTSISTILNTLISLTSSRPYFLNKTSIYTSPSVTSLRVTQTLSDGTNSNSFLPLISTTQLTKLPVSSSSLYTIMVQTLRKATQSTNLQTAIQLSSTDDSDSVHPAHESSNGISKVSAVSGSVFKHSVSKSTQTNTMSKTLLMNGNSFNVYNRSDDALMLIPTTTLQPGPPEFPEVSRNMDTTSNAEDNQEYTKIHVPSVTAAGFPTQSISLHSVISPSATIKTSFTFPFTATKPFNAQKSANTYPDMKLNATFQESDTSSNTKLEDFPPSYYESLSTTLLSSSDFSSVSTVMVVGNTPSLPHSSSNLFIQTPILSVTAPATASVTKQVLNVFTNYTSSTTAVHKTNPTLVKITSLIISATTTFSIHSTASSPYQIIDTTRNLSPAFSKSIQHIKYLKEHSDYLSKPGMIPTTNQTPVSSVSNATADSTPKRLESMLTASGESKSSGTRSTTPTRTEDTSRTKGPSAGKSRNQNDDFVFGVGISAGALFVISICGLALWILSKRRKSWSVPVVNNEFDIDGKTECREDEIRLHRLEVIPESEPTDNPTFETHDETELQISGGFK